MKRIPDISVECSESHGKLPAPTPRRFHIGEKTYQIKEVLDCWLGVSHHYFKVLTEDNAIFILKQDLEEGGWHLTLFSLDEALKGSHYPFLHPGVSFSH